MNNFEMLNAFGQFLGQQPASQQQQQQQQQRPSGSGYNQQHQQQQRNQNQNANKGHKSNPQKAKPSYPLSRAESAYESATEATRKTEARLDKAVTSLYVTRDYIKELKEQNKLLREQNSDQKEINSMLKEQNKLLQEQAAVSNGSKS